MDMLPSISVACKDAIAIWKHASEIGCVTLGISDTQL